MKAKRILAALLAAIMLTGSLAACAGGDGDGETTADPNAPAESETGSIFSDALDEDLDYDGDEVTFISRDKKGWTDSEISADTLTGEPVNDAVFERNKAVEERLNVKIISLTDNTDSINAVVQKVATAVNGGSKDYDIMAAPCCSVLPWAPGGTFANVRREECEYLDLDRIWWSQGFNEAVEFKGVQYAILGSSLLSMYRFGFITVFNKDIFIEANQAFPYEYVENGTWTLDKQASIAPLFYRDDGDGKLEETDRYGFVSNTYTTIDAYWSACQLDIVKKDENGDLALVLDMNRLHSACDKIINLFYHTDNGTYKYPGSDDDPIWNGIRSMFANGNAAMATQRFMEMENEEMRSMEQQYGVVPLPKYDESQDGYYTLLHDQFTVISIPATVTGERLTEMSAVLEAMSSVSYHLVRPVYYEDTLRTKIAQDPVDAEMMDIITENVYIDAGILYVGYMGLYHHGLRSVIQSATNNSISKFKAKNAIVAKILRNLSASYDKLIENEQND